MINKEKQLLCTFSNSQNINELIEKINSFYIVIEKKFFIFCNTKNITEYYITYNVDIRNELPKKFTNTISIHRKKNYNVLYTLNGMNKLITEENNGVFDKTFQLNWDLYRNSLILTNDVGIKIIPLTLVDIIK
jgi:hypothetical protein